MKDNWITGLLEHWSDEKSKTSTGWNAHTPPLLYSTAPFRKAGLTLIEVMLAIVILGIGAGTLLVATSRCVAVATKARHYSTAHRLIQQVNVEKPLTRGEIYAGVESGTFENGYSWQREIIENENEDREGLYTVRTRISWSASGPNAFEETVAYLYVPPAEERSTRIGGRRR
jgi:prepilin-type N-terminal cleavage/methylation domain-containing protein